MADLDMDAYEGPTNQTWDYQYHTLRREKLFRNPPTDRTAYPALQEAVNPHIESFNAIFGDKDGGKPGLLDHAVAEIGTKIFLDGDDKTGPAGKNKLKIRFKKIHLGKAIVPVTNKWAKDRNILPSECRERHVTYRGKLTATMEYQLNDGDPVEFHRELGVMPIMVKSNRCHLEDNSPAELVARKEESEELGGYFIINGNEKIIRLLLVNRRNFPMAIIRPSFQKRGAGYTSYGIIFRAVRPDETSQTNVLHYLNDGNITFRFSWRKGEYIVPVMMILKALLETSDLAIFESLLGKNKSEGSKNTFLVDRVEVLLRTYKAYQLYSKKKTRAYLGNKFRFLLGIDPTVSDYEAGTEFLRKVVCVHLGENNRDKYELLLVMCRKLYALAAGECAVDNPDAVQNQEILLGGFLYAQILKERLEELLTTGVRMALRDYRRKHPNLSFTSTNFANDFPGVILKKANENLGNALEYFLSTGNLISASGLDLQQISGFVVVAEKLNFLRFISHFRMVHRGSFFAQLKTTTVRKLLPESWGFLCPVHTPDGGPCGLLSHFAHKCKIMTEELDASNIPALVRDKLGALPLAQSTAATSVSVPVLLDGRVLGFFDPETCKQAADQLRKWKVNGKRGVPVQLEIGYVPPSRGGSYPGLFMSSKPSRLIRPVKYVANGKEDWVGPLEQPYMSIAVTEPEIRPGDTTHVEYSPSHIFSILASMTPFSNQNQSPRNMYQCQMGKQTMGTPATALAHRTDNKMYRIQTGQTPIVRTPLHNTYGFDNFPNGMNAIVAVISYTGYDMDDAMIINKSAHDRGFGFGSVYKTKKVSLKETTRSRTANTITKMFGFAPNSLVKPEIRELLDADGLPYVGRRVLQGEPICAYHTVTQDSFGTLTNRDGITSFEKYKEAEVAYIDEVRIIGADTGNEPLQTVSIKLRVPRAPVIGDKFSSRHGQKGVCSQKWPTVDMPFSESGMQPDVIINPHAFPSRMTIGMFVESLAGKAGAMHGIAQDATPFQFDEQNTSGDYFGKQLVEAGYNYHGNEPMYSGITGEEFAADIYIGCVYYQRLRHMVNDKYQVRTTGPIVPTTGQPIKGRKRGGGIRVGEMERDSLLAHGAAFLLQDRLLNCSDYSKTHICRDCGSFLSVQAVVSHFLGARKSQHIVRCRGCARRVDEIDYEELMKTDAQSWEDGNGDQWIGGENTTVVVVPGALKFLDVELAAMGVKMRYKVDKKDLIRPGMLVQEEPVQA
ncbi:hypothetical protein V8F06_002413 [Rhypophila decipiens]